MAAGRTSRQLRRPGDVASHGPAASSASTHTLPLATLRCGTQHQAKRGCGKHTAGTRSGLDWMNDERGGDVSNTQGEHEARRYQRRRGRWGREGTTSLHTVVCSQRRVPALLGGDHCTQLVCNECRASISERCRCGSGVATEEPRFAGASSGAEPGQGRRHHLGVRSLSRVKASPRSGQIFAARLAANAVWRGSAEPR